MNAKVSIFLCESDVNKVGCSSNTLITSDSQDEEDAYDKLIEGKLLMIPGRVEIPVNSTQ